jgi:thiamine kinase-like enzyme
MYLDCPPSIHPVKADIHATIPSNTPPEILTIISNAKEVSLLNGGAVNECFQIVTETETFAFRLGISEPTRYGFNRDEELAFYLEGERLGIAPPLRASDPANGILVMHYIDGTLVDNLKIRSSGMLRKVISLVQTLHKVECSKSCEGKTVQHIRFFMDKLKEKQALPRDWELFINRSIVEMPSSKLVLCHNDLAFNLLEDKCGKLWVIDFECAGWNNPAFDLAFLCIWYEFTEDEKKLLLDLYSEKKISLSELNSAIRLGLLFSALWSRLEVTYGDESYQKQAQELYHKAVMMNL